MVLVACARTIVPVATLEEAPSIYPDYVGVTIPVNIAPLNFKLAGDLSGQKVSVTFSAGDKVFRATSGKCSPSP